MDTDTREEFRRLITELDAVRTAQRLEQEQLSTDYKAAVVAKAAELYPPGLKGKQKAAVRQFLKENTFETAYAVLGEIAGTIQGQFGERATAMAEQHRDKVEGIRVLAKAMAVTSSICRGDLELTLRTVSSSDYNSQGFGAHSYAKSAAEQACDQARVHGLEANVVKTNSRVIQVSGAFGGSTEIASYEARVKVKEQLDLELVRYKPGATTREWVRMCWKRGVNPRVYNPFLPHGLEEQLGLDFLGNDLEKKDAPAKQP